MRPDSESKVRAGFSGVKVIRRASTVSGMNRSLFLAVLVPLLAFAAPREIGPTANLSMEISTLMPGDELILRGGTYSVTSLFRIDRNGMPGSPIVIRSKTGEQAIINRPNANQNIVDIASRYLELRDLEFSGGSAGLRFLSGASFITIEGCNVHDTEDVAIRANDTGALYDGFRIVRNQVHHTGGTGEGMYLGCNSAGCRFANGLIAGNWVHHMNGPTIVQGDGIEVKEGSYNNVIRDNVIHDTNYPCLTLYSAGTNSATPNIIERNVMWRCGDHGIQVTRDARVQNNIVLSAASDGISVQAHAQVPSGPGAVQIVNNTVLDADGSAIAVRGATSAILVANNAVYTSSGAALFVNGSGTNVTFSNNVGVGTAAMITMGNLTNDFVGANLGGTVPNDVFPKMGSALIGAGLAPAAPMDDFNGTTRTMPTTVGAYQSAAMNPGWTIAAGFKAMSAGGGAGGGSAGGASAGGTASAGGAASAGGTASLGGGSAGGGALNEMPKGCGCSTDSGAFAMLAMLSLMTVSRRAR